MNIFGSSNDANGAPQLPPLSASESTTPAEPGWERKLIEKVVLEQAKETKRKRRWRTFFICLGFLYAFTTLAAFMGWFDFLGGSSSTAKGKGGAHTAVVRLDGVIDDKGPNSADHIIDGLRDAFKATNVKGVVLHINSPGGSPVQSRRIFNEMKRLRDKYKDIPLYAVVEELCASGGYYVAAGADKIYVDPASIVGSVGVIMGGFGFTEAMQKLGVERRTLTAGKNKALMDSFSPVVPEQREHMQSMLNEVHQQFIGAVKQGRGARLKGNDADLFNGLVWSGDKSIALGLTDAVGDLDSVARDIVKAEDIVDYTVKESPFEKIAKRLGASFSAGMLDTFQRAAVTKF